MITVARQLWNAVRLAFYFVQMENVRIKAPSWIHIFLKFLFSGLCHITSMYYDNSSLLCKLKLSENDPCSYSAQCLGDMKCTNGMCTCTSTITEYFDSISISCQLKTSFNTKCFMDRTCRSDLDLICLNNLCNCNPSQLWSGSKCI